MKSNWIRNVVVIVSLVCGTVCTTAFADNKHGGNFGSSMHMMQGNGQSNVARSLSSQSLGSSSLNTFKPQIKTLNGNLGQLNGNNHSLSLTPKLSGITLNGQLQNKPTIINKVGGLNGIGSSQGSQGLNLQLLNSNAAKKINPAILGNKCVPGCNPGCFPGGCSPCKIGCNPWWWGCYSWCYPTYKVCYPVIYTQPIVIPVSTPVV